MEKGGSPKEIKGFTLEQCIEIYTYYYIYLELRICSEARKGVEPL